jgi:hypothetical protein
VKALTQEEVEALIIADRARTPPSHHDIRIAGPLGATLERLKIRGSPRRCPKLPKTFPT